VPETLRRENGLRRRDKTFEHALRFCLGFHAGTIVDNSRTSATPYDFGFTVIACHQVWLIAFPTRFAA